MEYSTKKQEDISELKKIYNALGTIKEIDRKIVSEEKKLLDIETELNNVINNNSTKFPKFESSYSKLKQKFKNSKSEIALSIRKISLISYIILLVGLVCWSGYNIFAYYLAKNENIFETILYFIGYEIFLVVPWILGGFKKHWFKG